MSRFSAPIAEGIWDLKYRMKQADGTPIDLTVEDTWRRIAKALSVPEKDSQLWEQVFYDALEDFRFLPAGRIIAGAGTGRQVTLFNCYVMGTILDSMGGIFDALKEAALTMQQGGGIGYDFSTLRPKNALVEGVAADASGPLSFMDVWDSMCRTIMSAGSRRGAMMATMRCDHPDIIDFVTAKHDARRLRMFNLSVLVTDPFMEAVAANKPWDLKFTDKHGVTKVYATIPAKDLWDTIMKSTYEYAEPGLIFIDRINKANNLYYVEEISATNPCGEQPLPPYGACLLGSINLAKMVKNAFHPEAKMDWKLLEKTVFAAVRMMDNVVDVSLFPLDQQQFEASAKRRLGLGVTGLADALIMLGSRYGSQHAQNTTRKIMRFVARSAYMASVDIAKEKGPFPLFDRDKYLASGYMQNMDDDVRDAVYEHGIRNSHLTSIAPTGTISLYGGNVSGGIEPVFAFNYERKVLQPDGTKKVEVVQDYALAEYLKFCEEQGMACDPEVLPGHFVTAQTLSPSDHVVMQAAAQPWIDSSISKTVNVPEDIPFHDFEEVYRLAYDYGCKGCTTYRPNDVTGSVLSVIQEPKAEPIPAPLLGGLVSRPEDLEGHTYKIKFPGDPHAMYVTLTYIVDEAGNKKPFEIFINSKNMNHYVWVVALTRMISAIFRLSSEDSAFIVEELKSVFDPKGGGFWKGQYTPSIVAAIGRTIERFMQEIGFTESNLVATEEAPLEEVTLLNTQAPDSCPSCGGFNLETSGGCPVCKDCGYSKCG